MLTCTPKMLPAPLHVEAAQQAIAINPANRPTAEHLDDVLTPSRLALLTSKYWGATGVKLTVGFMEVIAADLRDRLLDHMNAWGAYCNATFAWTQQISPQVRISRGQGGYWSYLGTDLLSVPANEPTMNLEGFTMQTPESEFHRVVRHETGHTLGFPHEHLRRELVARIDPAKAIAYFGRTQGWSAAMVTQQVLTPLQEASILGTAYADQDSIMCYQLPASITTDGLPIDGGIDIDPQDQAFAAKVYPISATPPPPPPPNGTHTLNFSGAFTIDGKTTAHGLSAPWSSLLSILQTVLSRPEVQYLTHTELLALINSIEARYPLIVAIGTPMEVETYVEQLVQQLLHSGGLTR